MIYLGYLSNVNNLIPWKNRPVYAVHIVVDQCIINQRVAQRVLGSLLTPPHFIAYCNSALYFSAHHSAIRHNLRPVLPATGTNKSPNALAHIISCDLSKAVCWSKPQCDYSPFWYLFTLHYWL